MAAEIIPAFQANDLSGTYTALRELSPADILTKARELLSEQFSRGEAISSPDDSREYLVSELAAVEHEIFAVLFLDTRHRIISFDRMLFGLANPYPCLKKRSDMFWSPTS